MFGLLKTKNDYEGAAQNVYRQVLEHTLSPCFYKEYGVPDSFDGRFDLLVLHLFVLIDYILKHGEESQAQDFNQALFDIAFSNMALGLREIGIGDMGMPKHMRRMMTGFNGRMHAYQEAQDSGDDALWLNALKNNLYGTLPDIEDGILEKMHDRIRSMAAGLESDHMIENILKGELCLKKK